MFLPTRHSPCFYSLLEVVYLVGVLAGAMLAVEQRLIGEGLVGHHFYAFAAARLTLAHLCHAVQLPYVVLCGGDEGVKGSRFVSLNSY